MTKEQYDGIQVMACKKCLSLKVIGEDEPFCGKCGNTTIIYFPNIYDWEKHYKEKYGKKFLDK